MQCCNQWRLECHGEDEETSDEETSEEETSEEETSEDESPDADSRSPAKEQQQLSPEEIQYVDTEIARRSKKFEEKLDKKLQEFLEENQQFIQLHHEKL